jgi:hypothetical protein
MFSIARSPLRIAALTALFTLAACGGGGDDTPATQAPAPAPLPTPAPAPAPSPAPGPAPTPAPAPATVSASGSITVTGAAPATYTPQSDGFTVETEASGTTYTFLRKNVSVAGTSTLYNTSVAVKKLLNGRIEVVYYNPQSRSDTAYFCSPCSGVTITPAAGVEHPVTVALTGAVLGTITLDGSLVGDASGAAWHPRELPRTTTGALTVNGTATEALAAGITTTTTPDSGGSRTVSITLPDGRNLGYAETLNGAGAVVSSGVTLIGSTVASFQSCNAACNVSVVERADGGSISFANTPLSNSGSLDGTVLFSKTQGTLTSPTLGSITPVHDAVESNNDERTYVFDVLGTPAQAGISLVTLVYRGSVLKDMAVVTGIGAAVYHCFETASTQPLVPACSGVTRAADLRSFTFDNVALQGGAVGVSTSITVSGTLVAKSL